MKVIYDFNEIEFYFVYMFVYVFKEILWKWINQGFYVIKKS